MPAIVAEVVAYIWPYLGETAVGYIGVGAVSLATIVGYAVVIGAAVAYSSSQNAKLRNALNGLIDSGRNVMTRDPLASQRGVYGQIPLAGPIEFMHTTGVKNEKLHVIEMIAGHECYELGTIYFENTTGLEEVPLDIAGLATGKYAGFFKVRKHHGSTQQVAEPDLVAAAPTLWTANHRLRGNSYLYMEFTYSTDLFPQGLPTVRCMTKGKKVLDPRVGIFNRLVDTAAGNAHIGCADCSFLTAGMLVVGAGIVQGTRIVSVDGSGTFFTVDTAPKLTNATARVSCGVDAWSANAALCCADYMADFKLGRRIPWYRIDATGLAAEANICDEDIVLDDTTTEKRYTCHGSFTADQDALGDLLSCMAGRRVDTGGTWALFAGAYHSPAVGADFTDDDLCGSLSVTPRQSMRESYSGVRGTFYSPNNNWQPSDFPAITNALYAADDGNLRRWKDVAYPFTISPATAQRLAKADLERGRQQIIVQAVYKLKAFKVQCVDTIRITRAELGWTNKVFEILKWELRVITEKKNAPFLAVAITARETAAAVWDWADGEETSVDLAPNTNFPDPATVANVGGLATLTDSTTVTVQANGTVQPRVKITWSLPNDIFVENGGFTEIEYKKTTDATFIPWSRPRGDAQEDWLTDVKEGVQYHIRARHINNIGVHSPAWVQVTTAAVVGDTVNPNAPTTITVVAKVGFLLVAWTPSTSVTTSEYYVERATAGAGGPFTLIGQTEGAQFADPNVTVGTTYWYRVRAQSFSGFFSAYLGPSTGVMAISGTTSILPPADPSAPVDQGGGAAGTYDADDGAVMSYRTIRVAPLPTDAEWQNLLYRRTGTSEYLVGAQLSNTVNADVRLDDLTPGIVYDIAVQAWSAGGASNVISGGLVTAPTKTALPTTPSGGSLSNDGVTPKLYVGTGIFLFGCNIGWAPNTDRDFKHFEVKATTTDTDAAVDYSWTRYDGVNNLAITTSPNILFYNLTLGAGYVRVRAINRSGIASNWYRIGNANSAAGLGAGSVATQSASSVNLTGGTITGITDLAIADGGTGSSSASGARSNLGLGTAATANLSSMGAISTSSETCTGTGTFSDLFITGSGTSVMNGNLSLNRIFLGNGSVGSPSLTFGGDTDTGIYWNSSGDMRFTTNGTGRLVVRDGAIVCIVPLKLDNAYVAGYGGDTGYVLLQDSSGTLYEVGVRVH